MYAIVVHSAGETSQSAGRSQEGDGNLNSEGWVVTRKFKDFETLHVKLKEVMI